MRTAAAALRGIVPLLLLAACDAGPSAASPDASVPAEGASDASPDAPDDASAGPPDATDGSPGAIDASPDASQPVDTSPPPGSWIVDVIDVGTGLAVFVRGHDFALLYDGGSNDDLKIGAGNRLIAYLKATAPELTTIDHLILSHPHRDHVELLPDVIATYRVREVWDSGAVNTICGYRAFLQAVADEPGVAYHTALSPPGEHAIAFDAQSCYGAALPAAAIAITHASQIERGTEILLGDSAKLTVLHADGASHGGRFNENSLVVRLELGAATLLFMGDAEGGLRDTWPVGPAAGTVEDDLLTCCADKLPAQVLIAGHHGSKTSSRSTFLDAVAPAITVISSGPRLYGSVQLPDAEVADELDRRGKVYRTDRTDSACATSAAKIGPDNDGKAGGCDNIRISVGNGVPTADYFGISD